MTKSVKKEWANEDKMVIDGRGQQTGRGGERWCQSYYGRNGVHQETIRALRSKVWRE